MKISCAYKQAVTVNRAKNKLMKVSTTNNPIIVTDIIDYRFQVKKEVNFHHFLILIHQKLINFVKFLEF